LCLVVDIEAYTRRDNEAQIGLQERLLSTIETAAAWAGVDLAACPRQDRGDGLLLLLPPQEAGRSRLTAELLRGMADALARTNRFEDSTSRGGRMRLRAALTQGLVDPAATGFVGSAVVRATRLLDAPPLRYALNSALDCDLAVITDDCACAETLRTTSGFLPVKVSISEKTFAAEAWVGAAAPGNPRRQPCDIVRLA
jgi:hypothetical protein